MKLILHCALLLFYIGFSAAALYREYQKRVPGEPPFCVDKLEGKKNVGERWQDPNQCAVRTCGVDAEDTPVIITSTCGVRTVGNNCILITPTEPQRYPLCCPYQQCADD